MVWPTNFIWQGQTRQCKHHFTTTLCQHIEAGYTDEEMQWRVLVCPCCLSKSMIRKISLLLFSQYRNRLTMIFYMTQVHPTLYIFTEFGRVRMPKFLSSLYEFVNLKNISTLLSVTYFFWHWRYPPVLLPLNAISLSSHTSAILSSIQLLSSYASSPCSLPSVASLTTSPPSTSTATFEVAQLLRMINRTSSKSRSTDILYQWMSFFTFLSLVLFILLSFCK